MAGYSAAPLARKLGIRGGTRVWALGAPANYRRLLAPMPADVTFVTGVSKRVDIIHLFTTSRTVLKSQLQRCLAKMKDNAAVWVSWPKKAAKVPTDITEDVVRAVALPLGFVDVKVCAVDDTWSALKLVVRREYRAGRRP